MVYVAEWTMAQVCGTCISQVRILSYTQKKFFENLEIKKKIYIFAQDKYKVIQSEWRRGSYLQVLALPNAI